MSWSGSRRQAGMVVDLSVEGEVRPYAAEVEQTAFRVVQEALTNVHKHAAGAKTYVRLAHRVSEIAMQVENEPPPEAGGGVGAAAVGGNGLVGMKERVPALGGVFVSGPTDAGGFRVSAVIPASVGGSGAGAWAGPGRRVGAGGVPCSAAAGRLQGGRWVSPW
ncbi:hypothetical protein SHIRM173S_13334 [Streptomyces hirsutus]